MEILKPKKNAGANFWNSWRFVRSHGFKRQKNPNEGFIFKLKGREHRNYLAICGDTHVPGLDVCGITLPSGHYFPEIQLLVQHHARKEIRWHEQKSGRNTKKTPLKSYLKLYRNSELHLLAALGGCRCKESLLFEKTRKLHLHFLALFRSQS